MHCSGVVDFGVEYEGQRTDVMALVSHDLKDQILLNWRSLWRLQIIPENFPKPAACLKTVSSPPGEVTIESLMKEFDDLFKIDGDLKVMKGGTMSIKMRDGPMTPNFVSAARKAPYALEKLVKAKLAEDEALRIIEKVLV